MARLLLRTALYFVHQEIIEVLRDSIASLNPETVELPAFSILSAMFTGAFGPPEKLTLALVPRSTVLRMSVKVAYGQ